jgi:hypothetical protein
MYLISKRRSLLTVLLQLAIFYCAVAQTKERPQENVGQKSQKYSLGLRIGPTVTMGKLSKTLSDTVLEAHSHKPKPGFTVMGQLVFPMQKKYSCLLEAGYARSGRRVSYNSGDWENNFTYNFLSATMGLRKTFQFHLREGVYYDWFVSIGPNVSYLVSGKGAIETSNGGRTPFSLKFSNLADSAFIKERGLENDINTYYFNKANRFFFGVDIGFGIDVPITKTQKVYGEFRATIGQTNIKNNNTKAYIQQNGGAGNMEDDPTYVPGNFSDPLKVNLKTFQFSLVYTLDFDKKLKNKGKSTNKQSNNKKRPPAKRRR